MTPVEGTVVPKKVDSLTAAYAEIRRDPYVFEWAGRDWTLPHLGELDFRLQIEIESIGENISDPKWLESLFARMFGKDQAAAWAEVEVPAPVLMLLFDRWIKYSGGELGEDEASKPSSKSTGTTSRRTSAGSTTSASPKRSTAAKAPAKAPAKRAPRKVAKKAAPAAGTLLTPDDAEWIAKHQALAAPSPPAS